VCAWAVNQPLGNVGRRGRGGPAARAVSRIRSRTTGGHESGKVGSESVAIVTWHRHVRWEGGGELNNASKCGLVVMGTAVVYGRWLRPWHMHWGATEDEAHGIVAGDELMPRARTVSTRVVEIAALPSAVWPWLVQMGPGRGGAYTYDWIERRLGVDIRNVDRVVPELQDLKVDDEIAMPGYTMRVERLDREQAMVVRSSDQAWLWAFELRPTNGHTRLISRNSFDTSKLRRQDWLAYPIIEPGSWVMERKMLLTIKQHAEELARTQGAANGPNQR
jgi:hypothetical protein